MSILGLILVPISELVLFKFNYTIPFLLRFAMRSISFRSSTQYFNLF